MTYLAHYGVRGMKWGVRRNTGALRLARGKRRFDFQTSTGRTLSTRVSRKQNRALKKRGYIDRKGNVNAGYEETARNYLLRQNVFKTTVAVAASAALIAKAKPWVHKHR